MLQANAVNRGASGDEQRSVIVAAEADVGGTLRHVDLFQLFAVGIEDVNLASLRCVQVTLDVDGHPVTACLGSEQFPAKLAVLVHFVAVDTSRELPEVGVRVFLVSAGVCDVEASLVR